jgi:hypothetical protein
MLIRTLTVALVATVVPLTACAGGTPAGTRPSTSTVTSTASVTVTDPALPPVTVTLPPPPPAVTFGPGLYLVGADVAPGEYRSDGPDGTGSGRCYWARLTDSTGREIVANALTDGPTRVTAVAGEYLEVGGCVFVSA